MTEKRDIFAELMEGMDALAADKAAANSSGCSYCGGSGDVCRADGEWLGPCPDCAVFIQKERDDAIKQAPVFTPFTDADAERLVRLLNGDEK